MMRFLVSSALVSICASCALVAGGPSSERGATPPEWKGPLPPPPANLALPAPRAGALLAKATIRLEDAEAAGGGA